MTDTVAAYRSVSPAAPVWMTDTVCGAVTTAAGVVGRAGPGSGRLMKRASVARCVVVAVSQVTTKSQANPPTWSCWLSTRCAMRRDVGPVGREEHLAPGGRAEHRCGAQRRDARGAGVTAPAVAAGLSMFATDASAAQFGSWPRNFSSLIANVASTGSSS